MTHLAQPFPDAGLFVTTFLDLDEAVTEEALDVAETDKDQTTRDAPAVGPGEPTARSVSITTDNRNVLLLFNM